MINYHHYTVRSEIVIIQQNEELLSLHTEMRNNQHYTMRLEIVIIQ